jgi:regulatory protein
VRRRKPDSAGADDAAACDPAAARLAALQLLNRRDYGAVELARKLAERGVAAGTAEAAVAQLVREKFVDDARYAGHFVGYHAARGQGPVRIAMDLRQAGVAEALVEAAVDPRAPAWRERCAGVRRRRFGAALPQDWTERGKQARFLQYRGFTSDQVRAVLGGDVAVDE